MPVNEPRAGDPRRHHRLAHLVGADDGLPIDPDLDPTDPSEPSPTHRRAPAPVHRLHPVTIAAIGLGGALGAWGRYEIGLALPTASHAFPSTTFMVNTSGAFALGLVLTLLLERMRATRARDHLRHFACIGVLGSWTTMSALAVDADALVRAGRPLVAAGYVLATIGAGIVAVALGVALGRTQRPVPSPEGGAVEAAGAAEAAP